ncbi:MAG: response regulator [Chloroflexota bacterium]
MIHEVNEPLAFIMEDDPKLAFIFEKCVKTSGFRTIVAADGGEAVELMETYTPDLFVLDLHVPVYSGDQILEMIKANPRFDHAKIILATADARMAELLRPEVHYVLDKPISSRQLKRLMERLVEQVSKPV